MFPDIFIRIKAIQSLIKRTCIHEPRLIFENVFHIRMVHLKHSLEIIGLRAVSVESAGGADPYRATAVFKNGVDARRI